MADDDGKTVEIADLDEDGDVDGHEDHVHTFKSVNAD